MTEPKAALREWTIFVCAKCGYTSVDGRKDNRADLDCGGCDMQPVVVMEKHHLSGIDAFLCENGLLKAEDPDDGDALFLTPGGYWESRECDDVGDHVDAIKKLVEWGREAGYFDGLVVGEEKGNAE